MSERKHLSDQISVLVVNILYRSGCFLNFIINNTFDTKHLLFIILASICLQKCIWCYINYIIFRFNS